MSRQKLNLVAALGAVAFIVQGALELAHTQGDPLRSTTDYIIEVAFAVGAALTLAGLLAFHRRVESAVSNAGKVAVRVAGGGQAVIALVAAGTAVRGHDVLGPLFPLGVAAWLLGTIVYAVSVTRSGAVPRWQPVTLAVGTVLGILADPAGALVLGAMWLVLAGAGIRAGIRDENPATELAA